MSVPFYSSWFLQSRSYGERNLQQSIWFFQLPWFNQTDCEGKKLPEFAAYSQFQEAGLDEKLKYAGIFQLHIRIYTQMNCPQCTSSFYTFSERHCSSLLLSESQLFLTNMANSFGLKTTRFFKKIYSIRNNVNASNESEVYI